MARSEAQKHGVFGRKSSCPNNLQHGQTAKTMGLEKRKTIPKSFRETPGSLLRSSLVFLAVSSSKTWVLGVKTQFLELVLGSSAIIEKLVSYRTFLRFRIRQTGRTETVPVNSCKNIGALTRSIPRLGVSPYASTAYEVYKENNCKKTGILKISGGRLLQKKMALGWMKQGLSGTTFTPPTRCIRVYHVFALR